MRADSPDPIPRSHRLTLILLSAALLLLALLPRDLWVKDEAIVGAVLREMVVDGQWLVPHVNGEIYPDKPPLYFWLAAAPAAATGLLTPLWFRLPAALAAIGCVWLLYALGARLFDRDTGLFASVILATSPLFAAGALIARMDMLLTLLVTAIFYCFARGMQEPAHPRRWFLAMYALAGLAFLTKALIGPVIAGVVIAGVLLWRREWRAWVRVEPIWGTLLFAAVILPWLAPAVLQEGMAYANAVLVKQSVGRAVQAFDHARPFYYYLYAFPATFLPWIVILPVALWRLRSDGGRTDWPVQLLLLWSVGLFVFFSAVSGKLVIYLLPLVPALALIVAREWRRAWSPTLFATLAVTGALLIVAARGAAFHYNASMSPKALGQFLHARDDGSSAMATYKIRPGLLNFYAERRFLTLENSDAVRDFLLQPTPAIAVIREEDRARIWDPLPAELRQLGRYRVADTTYLVLATPATPTGPERSSLLGQVVMLAAQPEHDEREIGQIE